jgi:hypothetical protein
MRILAALLVALTGCTIYAGGDDHPDPIFEPDAGQCNQEPVIGQPLRLIDPATLTCVDIPTGSCDSCGICTPPPLPPPWAPCESACTGLDEASCATQDGCHVARGTEYLGCYQAVEPGGPLACEGLNVYTCADQTGCISIHDDATRAFVECIDEVPPCAGADEAGCIGNAACEPLYRGVDCTCTPDSCTCASQEYVECRDAP